MKLNSMVVLARPREHCIVQHAEIIAGFTTKNSVPLSCPVFCYSRKTGLLISQGVSKPNGRYVLTKPLNQECLVVALDPQKEYNLATQDNVK
jgi:hypothetical protein